MLYIKFRIQDSSKYVDFESLFEFMMKCRDSDFQFKESVAETEVDWNSLSEEEMEKILDEEEEREINPIYLEMKHLKELMPKYAMSFIQSFAEYEQQGSGHFGFDLDGILSYLIIDFEVDMDQLIRNDTTHGTMEFSTGNYPFGGLERFFMTLKAYDLIPFECFNGFEVHDLQWTSDFEYQVKELPDKTKDYLSQFKS